MCGGKGVCADYAEGFCLLARHAGFNCRVISTDTHAFDAVELDDKWYLLDPLWDDNTEEDSTEPDTWMWFGFTTETALAEPDHIYDTKRYPVSDNTLHDLV